MSQYLRFRAGLYDLLLAVEDIVEVGEAGAGGVASSVSGWRLWREHSLPVVSLPRYLDAGADTGARAQQIVLRDEAAGLSIIDVDHVDGLVSLDAKDFTDIAALSPALAELIDAVASTGAGQGCLLRLRRPLAWREHLRPAPLAESPDPETLK